MSRATQLFVLLLATLGASQPAAAQWLKHPTPGIPRTADGQADLKAPAPRTADGRPDLSGMWGWQPGKYFGALWVDRGPDHLQPWAFELVKQRAEHMGKDDPANFDCVPQGPRMNLFSPIPVKFVQTPALARDPVRGHELPADLPGREGTAEGPGPELHGLFGGPLGGRHARRRDNRVQGPHLARLRGDAAHRAAAHHRAHPSHEFRPPRERADHRRPRRVQGALHGDAGRAVRARHRAPRVRVRRERAQPASLHRHDVGAGQGAHGPWHRAASGGRRKVRRRLRPSHSRKPHDAAALRAARRQRPPDDGWRAAAHRPVGDAFLRRRRHVRHRARRERARDGAASARGRRRV